MANGTPLYDSTTGLSTVFSGSDVVVIFGNEYVGECMSFTLGINRESGPLHVMGKKSPIAFPKGKRGLGGSFVLAQLGYDALLKFIDSVQPNNKDIYIRHDEVVLQNTGRTRDSARTPATANVDGLNVADSAAAAATELWDITQPFYADQIPPFNMTIVGMNEQGAKMAMRVYGVQILNDGFGVSVDELNIEKRYTYVATAATKMDRLF